MFLRSIYQGFSVASFWVFWCVVIACAFITYRIEKGARQPERSGAGDVGFLFLRPLTLSVGVALLLPRLAPTANLTVGEIFSHHFIAILLAPVVAFVFLLVTNMLPGVDWLMGKQALQVFIEGLVPLLFILHGRTYPGLLAMLGYALIALVLSYAAIGVVGLFVVPLSRGDKTYQETAGNYSSPVLNSTAGLIALAMYALHNRL
jgi:hypothetical protein